MPQEDLLQNSDRTGENLGERESCSAIQLL